MVKISSQSALGKALEGIQRGLKSAAENASKIANFSSRLESGDDASLVKAMVDLKQDLNQVKASRKVVSVIQEEEEKLLDTLA